jgi:hypothetical protein
MMPLSSPTIGRGIGMSGNRRNLSTHKATTFVRVHPDDEPSATRRSPLGEWVLHDPENVLDDRERKEILDGAWKDHPNGILGPDDDASGAEPWPAEAFDPDHVVSWWLEWRNAIEE